MRILYAVAICATLATHVLFGCALHPHTTSPVVANYATINAAINALQAEGKVLLEDIASHHARYPAADIDSSFDARRNTLRLKTKLLSLSISASSPHFSNPQPKETNMASITARVNAVRNRIAVRKVSDPTFNAKFILQECDAIHTAVDDLRTDNTKLQNEMATLFTPNNADAIMHEIAQRTTAITAQVTALSRRCDALEALEEVILRCDALDASKK